AARQPTLIPRKQAIKTRFVKKVRNITVLPNHRMHVSSKNRRTKLIRKSSRWRRRSRDEGAAVCVVAVGEVSSAMGAPESWIKDESPDRFDRYESASASRSLASNRTRDGDPAVSSSSPG